MSRSLRLMLAAAGLALGACSLIHDLEPIDGMIGGDAGVDMPTDLPPRCADSSSCPASAPLCTMGQCSACPATGMSSECSSHHAPALLCGPAGGCVECLSKDDCARQGRTCNLATFTCAPCVQHGDCATGVCKSGGACAGADEVAYVNNALPCSDSVHPSTRSLPYCQINFAANQAGKSYVVVAGSAAAYGAVSLTALAAPIGPITIVGPGRSATLPARVTSGGSSPAVAVSTPAGTAAVTVDGFEIIGPGGATPAAGIQCSQTGGNTATLKVLNSYIHNSGQYGVDSSNCTVTLDANSISSNQGGGVSVAGTTSYTITNNIIASNGVAASAGVTIANGATGIFAFNTVAKNRVSAGVGGIDCGTGGTKMVLDSIVWGNDLDMQAGTQVGSKCVLSTVVTGTADSQGIRKDPAFVSTTNFRLDVSTGAAQIANLDCCIDTLAAPATPNSDHDVDGAKRPKGTGSTPYDIGAHEVQ